MAPCSPRIQPRVAATFGLPVGREYLQGKAAAVEVKHGDGRVILLGFRPQWRGQPFGTFRVLFNAILR